MNRYESWGRYPSVQARGAVRAAHVDALPRFEYLGAPVLPYGRGRSYGDTCLNENGFLIDTAQLNRILAFDRQCGVIRCEAGVTLGEILARVVARGWFLPVTPGTKHVSVGGALAHDVHGKNHHVAGTFGRYVRCFELLRSSGERLVCSPQENADLFRATIGGMGLTGLVLWADVQLKPIAGPMIRREHVRFGQLGDFFTLSAESSAAYEYTVAWLDCLVPGRAGGRGIFVRGNHAGTSAAPGARCRPSLNVRFDAPEWLLHPAAVRVFNAFYFRMQARKKGPSLSPFEPFFYPLDALHQWNRLYGRRGFLQYQCAIPPGDAPAVLDEMLARVAISRQTPFLTVLKAFGDLRSPGMMSFPRPGITLALDFSYRGAETLALLECLDAVLRAAGGAVYPAKDARMSPESFNTFFPQWPEFARYVDPCFSSSFWRRVRGGGPETRGRRPETGDRAYPQ